MYQHLSLGPNEWRHTANLLTDIHQYWSHTFNSIAEILELTHNTLPTLWHQESIAGHVHCKDLQNTLALTTQNRFVKEMYENGLKLVGQLFKTNGMQTIITTQIKLRRELEDEFNIALTDWQYRSIVILTRDIRQNKKKPSKEMLQTP